MKLQSTQIFENHIEIAYGDNADLEAADSLLIVRLPRKPDDSKSLAWNRYWALGDLQEIIRELRNADRDIVEAVS